MDLTRRKKILYTLVTLVILALAVEVVIRLGCWITGRTPYTAATPWMVADDDLIYRFKPNFDGDVYHVHSRINNQGLRDDDFPTSKPSGEWRMLCLGDSRTFGYSVAQNESYPAQLERMLRTQPPDRAVQVINAGRPAYSTYQGLRFLEREGLEFQPDVVSVAFGFNGRRFVLEAEQADGPEWVRRVARDLRIRHRIRASYTLLAVSKVLRRFFGVDTWKRDVLELPSQKLDDLHCRVDKEAFRDQLRSIARVCRDNKMDVVFIAMADAPPIENAFTSGMALRQQGKYDEAIEAFTSIRENADVPVVAEWSRALVQYEIGLTREKQGRTTEAQAAYRKSAQAAAFWSVSGGTPVRHARDYDVIMREVADEFDAPCVDIAALLADRPDLFTDHCHYTEEGHRRIAEALADCLRKHNLLP
jgi:lysophospholipase L1-like esterase